MLTSHRRFTCKSVSKFSAITALLVSFLFAQTLHAAAANPNFNPPQVTEMSDWQKFDLLTRNRERADYVNGLSYIISGSIAIVGGFLGASVTNDPIEKGVYNIFQSIGIASIGYGAYTWQLGDHERLLHETIRSSQGLDDRTRSSLVKSYMEISKDREKRERLIRAITHGLIASYNLYQASQQSNPAMKNTMTFIGGVNVLATISFAF